MFVQERESWTTSLNNMGLDIRCLFDVLSNAHSGAVQAWYF